MSVRRPLLLFFWGGGRLLGAGLFVFSPACSCFSAAAAGCLPPCLLPAKRTERTAAEPHSATVTPTINHTHANNTLTTRQQHNNNTPSNDQTGTLRSYFESQIALARGTLKLQLFDKQKPIYTEPRTLPPTKLTDSSVRDTLLGDGCRVIGARLRGCVVGSCTYIDRGADLEDVVCFGADGFERAAARAADLAAGGVPLGVGAGARARRAVIDKNARIGRDVVLVNRAGVREATDAGGSGGAGALPKGVVIRDGILVVRRDAVIPDGTVV